MGSARRKQSHLGLRLCTKTHPGRLNTVAPAGMLSPTMQCSHSQMQLRSSTPGSTRQILSQKPCKQNKQPAYPHQIWKNSGLINRSLKPEERSTELFIASPLSPNTIHIHTYVDTHTYTHTQEACMCINFTDLDVTAYLLLPRTTKGLALLVIHSRLQGQESALNQTN